MFCTVAAINENFLLNLYLKRFNFFFKALTYDNLILGFEFQCCLECETLFAHTRSNCAGAAHIEITLQGCSG